jgi:hypothetical protein
LRAQHGCKAFDDDETLRLRVAYSAAVDIAELDWARFILDRTHAFTDPHEADAAGIRLILRTPEILSGAT